MYMKHEGFHSSRLMMELIRKEHASKAFDVFQHRDLYMYLPQGVPTLYDLEKQYSAWECTDSPDGAEYWLNWVVVHKITQKIIGRVQIGIDKDKKEGSIAYMIGVPFQGKGYGTESVQALLTHCKNKYGVLVFKAWIDTRNVSSIRLVEKLGMERIEFIEKADHFDGEDSDEFVFQKLCTTERN